MSEGVLILFFRSLLSLSLSLPSSQCFFRFLNVCVHYTHRESRNRRPCSRMSRSKWRTKLLGFVPLCTNKILKSSVGRSIKVPLLSVYVSAGHMNRKTDSQRECSKKTTLLSLPLLLRSSPFSSFATHTHLLVCDVVGSLQERLRSCD